MGVATGCGCKEDFLILLIPTPLVSVLFCSSIPTFCSFYNVFRSLYNYLCIYIAYEPYFYQEYIHNILREAN